MFLSWFDYAHHDPEPLSNGSGVQPEPPSGFPLKACGNEGLPEGTNSTQKAAEIHFSFDACDAPSRMGGELTLVLDQHDF